MGGGSHGSHGQQRMQRRFVTQRRWGLTYHSVRPIQWEMEQSMSPPATANLLPAARVVVNLSSERSPELTSQITLVHFSALVKEGVPRGGGITLRGSGDCPR